MPPKRKCLIVERHEWETGGAKQQVQLPLEMADAFFGEGKRALHARVFLDPTSDMPTFEQPKASISKVYKNGTRRINGFPELGWLGRCFIFIEETSAAGVYNVWFQATDLQVVVAKHRLKEWDQGKNSQYGRGRLVAIVDAPVQPRVIDHI